MVIKEIILYHRYPSELKEVERLDLSSENLVKAKKKVKNGRTILESKNKNNEWYFFKIKEKVN
ncbi:MAG: hypothetical protein MUE91_07270 [Ignavibacteriaceae bacterium]|jgi:hypothetical protein|nr:hypothetical protein [Ignavibacteriaceae bacterium]